MKQFPFFAKMYGPIILAVSLIWICISSRQLNSALAVAYISGTELLWRISGGSILHEFGKFAVILVCIAGIIRGPKLNKTGRLLILYFVALMPGVFFADWSDLGLLKINLSNNLSGPTSLAIVGIYFSGLRISYEEVIQLLLAFLLPICSLSLLLLFSISTADEIAFSERSSNFTASGGFGPNQVSSCLAAGCLLAYFLSRLHTLSLLARWTATMLTFLWLGQAALTFSRGGVYIFCGSVFISMPFLLSDKMQRRRLLEWALLGASCVSILLGSLLAFTEGKLLERFSDAGTSNRATLAQAEMESFKAHPFLGVGLGGTEEVRFQAFETESSSHTEMTRLLSEHGLLGVLALGLLVCIPIARVFRTREPFFRAFVASSTTYSFLFMATSGMRLAVVSFVYGLAMMAFVPRQGDLILSLPRRT